MFQLPNNPPWNLLVKAVRWVLAFLVTGILVFPASAADLLNEHAFFAWVEGGLYVNTGQPGTYVKVWPCECGGGGGGTTAQLPTVGGAFISAVWNPSDGSHTGNWYDTVTGNVVYFRPDTKLFYVFDGSGFSLPGAVEWIPAVYYAAGNTFKTPGGSAVTWETANRWFVASGMQLWSGTDFYIPFGSANALTFSPPISVGIRLIPDEREDSGLVLYTASNGNSITAYYSTSESPHVKALYISVITKHSPSYFTAENYAYVFSADGYAPGWYNTNEAVWVPVSAPDLGVIDTIQSAYVANQSGSGLAEADGYLLKAGV